MSQPSSDLAVAQTILQQLGGQMFLRMTGAKHLLGDATSLHFQLPRDAGFVKDGINHVKITLRSDDTYTLEFLKVRGTNVAEVAKDEMIHVDMLRQAFTERTGLQCSLGRSRGRGEREILYDRDGFWIKKNAIGDYEIYQIGVTHSTRVATIGRNLKDAWERAKTECERRALLAKETAL